MNQSLKLVDHGVFFGADSHQGLRNAIFDGGVCLGAEDEIIFTSSSELAALGDPEFKSIYQELRHRYPNCPIRFVSQACLGLYASVLHASRTAAQRSLVVFWERDTEIGQKILMASGASLSCQELLAKAGTGWMLLSKNSRSDGLNIHACEIISQPKGLMGPSKLISKTIRHCEPALRSGAQVVSFAINSVWSDELLKGFSHWSENAFHPSQWLASLEVSNEHYLTLKPLMEIDAYASTRSAQGLLIMSLGAGGRLGCIHIASSEAPAFAGSVNEFKFSVQQDWPKMSHALQSEPVVIKSQIKYVNRAYRGFDNAIFIWELDCEW